jgi:hypothetical protein
MPLGELVEEVQRRVVTIAGLRWEIRPICSEDVLLCDATILLAVPVDALGESSTIKGAAARLAAATEAGDKGEALKVVREIQRVLRRMGAPEIAETSAARTAVAMAGTVAGEDPRIPGVFEPVRLVKGDTPSSYDPRTGSVLNVSRLPQGTTDALAEAILDLSRGGAWVKALDSLRTGSADPGPARPDRDATPHPDP